MSVVAVHQVEAFAQGKHQSFSKRKACCDRVELPSLTTATWLWYFDKFLPGHSSDTVGSWPFSRLFTSVSNAVTRSMRAVTFGLWLLEFSGVVVSFFHDSLSSISTEISLIKPENWPIPLFEVFFVIGSMSCVRKIVNNKRDVFPPPSHPHWEE